MGQPKWVIAPKNNNNNKTLEASHVINRNTNKKPSVLEIKISWSQ
jgi:hypothetical protein